MLHSPWGVKKFY
ncbi:hypothetical protein A2U01_0089410 [Trifolium medium]|uniref:Uncharacterized protein n=1 Tax=Trifolium medium TaxID=97028 RepID=A0A392U3Y1_9FABA|nr:hypothetical protein [Trifolium medium]